MKKVATDLFKLKDDTYAKFTAKLIPNIDSSSIIGVRTPELRKYAKEFIKDECFNDFMNELPHKYHEENMLHGFIIGMNKDLDETLNYLNKFLPYINNWAVCDTISPKIFKKDLKKVYKNIKLWVKSDDIYTVRFGIVTLLQFYLDDEFDEEYNKIISNIKSDEYYINIAASWYFSFALIKQYDKTIKLFESKTLNKWVHNKSIQKAIESYRINDEKKQYLKTLKIV